MNIIGTDRWQLTRLLFCIIFATLPCLAQAAATAQTSTENEAATGPETIRDIKLVRHNKNKFLTDEGIYDKLLFKKGQEFDQRTTSPSIHNLYDINKPYGFFEQVYIYRRPLADNQIDIIVATYEKPELEEIIIVGNKNINDEDIEKQLNMGDIRAINEIDVQRIVRDLRKLYQEHNYQLTDIAYTISKQDGKSVVVLTICENEKSLIKRVLFSGNRCMTDKQLKKILFTREDWWFGFITKAGTYQPNIMDYDKYLLEMHYRNNGYYTAKVTGVDVAMDPVTKQYTVTFNISEGECYTIGEVHVIGNELISEDFLLREIPLKPGQMYMEKNLKDSLEKLRLTWGEYGYIFADVEPIVIPNNETRTIDITLKSELGNKVFANRVTISGNEKTRDKVIRRRLFVKEGQLLTTAAMEDSKLRVENLGYFDPRAGVNWKINRLTDERADLELMVKEVKTGHMGASIGVGGSQFNIASPAQGANIGLSLSDSNFLGTGIVTRAGATWSKQEWDLGLNVADPYFMDKPIMAEANFAVTKTSYDKELRQVESFDERIIGGFVGTGATFNTSYFKETAVSARLGGDSISHDRGITLFDNTEAGASQLKLLLERRFKDGTLAYFLFGAAQDFRNHTLHPSSGYQWAATTKIGFGPKCDNLGFVKLDLDGSWYTPLIDNYTLILGLHGHFGIVGTYDNREIPYRELYHIGGPASVRGFTYGQIGPTFLGDSIGATRGFWINTELIFPITSDLAIKGALFYDGGAGWRTSDFNFIEEKNLQFLQNNSFNFRHAIGFGIRMLRPQPIKIDIGFKLDKRRGEPAHEVHFSTYREF